MFGWSSRSRSKCFAAMGLLGIMSFFQPPEDPGVAVKRFVERFTAKDADGITKMIQPEMLDEKEVTKKDVENFLTRYMSRSLVLSGQTIDRRFKDEEGTTERFQSTILFKGPVLAPEYPEPATLKIVLLWVQEKGQWLIERPLSIDWLVTSKDEFPTSAQEEVAMRFEAALSVLEKIGRSTPPASSTTSMNVAGSSQDDYAYLERLHTRERGSQGVDPQAMGIEVLLRIAGRKQGALLKPYHGDFKTGAGDNRREVPWEAFKDYVNAAVEQGRALEKQGNKKRAEYIYRSLLRLGTLIEAEPGGVLFISWGLTFQRQASEELLRLLPSASARERQQLSEFVGIASRRLDLLQTALGCLDEMEDFKSLKAAIVAATRPGENMFRLWGINTLAILGLKGAPAGQAATRTAGGLVLVRNQAMQDIAMKALEKPAAEASGQLKLFIEHQKQWVKTHRVYGTASSFQ